MYKLEKLSTNGRKFLVKYLHAVKYSVFLEIGYLAVWTVPVIFTVMSEDPNAAPQVLVNLSYALIFLFPLVELSSFVLLIFGCYRHGLTLLPAITIAYLFVLTHIYTLFLLICWSDGPAFYGFSHITDLLAFSIPCLRFAAIVVAPIWAIKSHRTNRLGEAAASNTQ